MESGRRASSRNRSQALNPVEHMQRMQVTHPGNAQRSIAQQQTVQHLPAEPQVGVTLGPLSDSEDEEIEVTSRTFFEPIKPIPPAPDFPLLPLTDEHLGLSGRQMNARDFSNLGGKTSSDFTSFANRKYKLAISYEDDAPPLSERIRGLVDNLKNFNVDAEELIGSPCSFVLFFSFLAPDDEYHLCHCELERPPFGMPYQLHEVISKACAQLATVEGSFIIQAALGRQDISELRLGTSETFIDLQSNDLPGEKERGRLVEFPELPSLIASDTPAAIHELSLAGDSNPLGVLLNDLGHPNGKAALLIYLYPRDLFDSPGPLNGLEAAVDHYPNSSLSNLGIPMESSPQESFQPLPLFHHIPDIGPATTSSTVGEQTTAVELLQSQYPETFSAIRYIYQNYPTSAYSACQVVGKIVWITKDLNMQTNTKKSFESQSINYAGQMVRVKIGDIEVATGISPVTKLRNWRSFFNKISASMVDLRGRSVLPQRMQVLRDAMELMVKSDGPFLATDMVGQSEAHRIAVTSPIRHWEKMYLKEIDRYVTAKTGTAENPVVL
ncbi:hypothetical protein DL96DRAFT_1563124 [Flagelloscypha sp. PMI_526]|nr:hypothetical protein DL96DRAFT_1563124 [Flagelloscypha sp. PMI_526]